MTRTLTRPRSTNAVANVASALGPAPVGSIALQGDTANIQWSSSDNGRCATIVAA